MTSEKKTLEKCYYEYKPLQIMKAEFGWFAVFYGEPGESHDMEPLAMWGLFEVSVYKVGSGDFVRKWNTISGVWRVDGALEPVEDDSRFSGYIRPTESLFGSEAERVANEKQGSVT